MPRCFKCGQEKPVLFSAFRPDITAAHSVALCTPEGCEKEKEGNK